MLTIDSYKKILSTRGRTLAEVSKKNSTTIIDNTFTYDPNYKKIYILGKTGWKFEDAKYQMHSKASILKDAVDHYLQFRPGVQYEVGNYVIIPDEDRFDIKLSEEELINPFMQPVDNRTEWWMIVGKDDGNTFVRYNIIRCNWNFKWIYNNHICECYGAVRVANSYTSGDWAGDYTRTFSNLTSAWIPDTYHCYGEKLHDFGLHDSRYIYYDQRFMISNNELNPICYRVTKIFDIIPQGLLKLSISQVPFDAKRDNAELKICDYYELDGNPLVSLTDNSKYEHNSVITQLWLNNNNELVEEQNNNDTYLHIGKQSFYKVTFTNNAEIDPHWKVDIENSPSEDKIDYYNNLLVLTKYDDNSISIKPSKAKSLIGKKFLLSVCDLNGDYYSSTELEVQE